MMKKYVFDDVMYSKENKCKTCKIDKPARSKHCRVCNHCVEKFDHHCIWINQCIGAKNYKWFLLFIFFHVIICFYGGIAGIAIFLGEKWLVEKNGGQFVNEKTGEKIPYSLWVHFIYFVAG